MPLLAGKENVGRNIKTEQAHGKPHKQAVAIALNKERASDAIDPREGDERWARRLQKGVDKLSGAVKSKAQRLLDNGEFEQVEELLQMRATDVLPVTDDFEEEGFEPMESNGGKGRAAWEDVKPVGDGMITQRTCNKCGAATMSVLCPKCGSATSTAAAKDAAEPHPFAKPNGPSTLCNQCLEPRSHPNHVRVGARDGDVSHLRRWLAEEVRNLATAERAIARGESLGDLSAIKNRIKDLQYKIDHPDTYGTGDGEPARHALEEPYFNNPDEPVLPVEPVSARDRYAQVSSKNTKQVAANILSMAEKIGELHADWYNNTTSAPKDAAKRKRISAEIDRLIDSIEASGEWKVEEAGNGGTIRIHQARDTASEVKPVPVNNAKAFPIPKTVPRSTRPAEDNQADIDEYYEDFKEVLLEDKAKGLTLERMASKHTTTLAEICKVLQWQGKGHYASDVQPVGDETFAKGTSPREKAGLTQQEWNALAPEKRKALIGSAKDADPTHGCTVKPKDGGFAIYKPDGKQIGAERNKLWPSKAEAEDYLRRMSGSFAEVFRALKPTGGESVRRVNDVLPV